MAATIHADLLLLHVYSVPASYTEIPAIFDTAAMKKNAEYLLEEIKAHLIKRGCTAVIKTAARPEDFFNELQSVCENIHPYVVVMGSQGTSASERFFFGSHAAYAVKHLDCPLITVPAKAYFSAIKKIGLACDFSNLAPCHAY